MVNSLSSKLVDVNKTLEGTETHSFTMKPIARAIKMSAIGVGFGLAHSVSQAATIMVNNNGDAGINCTLRDAVVSMNNGVGVPQAGCSRTGDWGMYDTITFSSAMTITLSAASGVIPIGIDAANSADITIDASSVSGVTIDADNESSAIIVNEGSELEINTITIINGNDFAGGGIAASTDTQLRILNSTISSNNALFGGGVFSLGEVEIDGSTISDNTASNGGGLALVRNATAPRSDEKYYSSADDSVFSGNTATKYGGGILINGAEPSDPDDELVTSSLVISGVTISTNTAANGGGLSVDKGLAFFGFDANAKASVISQNVAIYDDVNDTGGNGGGVHLGSEDGQSGLVALSYQKYNLASSDTVLTISGNTSDKSGGGVYSKDLTDSKYGNFVALTSSTVSGNSANNGTGGGLHFGEFTQAILKYSTIDSNQSFGRGGGFYQKSDSYFNVYNSTVSNNIAGENGGSNSKGGGGGVIGGELILQNSTVSGNSSGSFGGGGGGLYSSENASIGLVNATVSNNTARNGTNLKYGGGVYFNNSSVEIYNSIIANSDAINDCRHTGGVITVDGYSIIEDGTCGATVTGDPGLGSLRNNGGRTQTHLPKENSKAINAGDNTTCSATLGGEFDPSLDQRGEVRPLTTADACDVGSVEVKESDRTSFYVIPLPDGKTVVIPL